MKKGEIHKLRIASLAPGGEGVSRDLGVPVFVNRVAPGDLAEVKLFDVRKDFARAEVVSLLEPSVVRSEPPCKLFKVCGGCQWQHVDYAAQLEAKADIIKQAIKHIGKLSPDLVLPAIGAVDPLFYRNKVQFPVDTVAASGRVRAGYYKEGTHELVNIKHCPVQPEPLDRVLEACKEAAQKHKLSTYDEKSGTGLLRHIALRYSFASNRILVTLVINAHADVPAALRKKLEAIAAEVRRAVAEVVGVCVNFNTSRGNRIMSDAVECLSGDSHLVEVLRSNLPWAPELLRHGIKYQLSSTSFFQVNSKQAAVLLDQLLLAVSDRTAESAASAEFPDFAPIPLIVDAYSGVGTMALWLSAVAQRVIAIEEWPAAISDAGINCRLNDINNVELIEAAVEDEAPRLVEKGIRPNVVVVDPPRKGLHQRLVGALIALKPGRIVYVSCNPSTLARDLRILEDNGYKTKRIQPVDMFPQTYHVESISVLDRSGS